MTKLFLLSLALAATPAFAMPKTLHIEMQYFEDGKLLAAPSITVPDQKSAEITEDKIHAKVTPKVVPGSPRDQIEIALEISPNGKSDNVFRPRLVALEGEPASVETGEVDKNGKPLGTHKVSVLVTEE